MIQYLTLDVEAHPDNTIEKVVLSNSFDESLEFHSKWKIKKFATKLKLGLEHDFLDEFNIKEWEANMDNYRNGIMPSLSITRRQALQLRGEKMREIHEDYWINTLMQDYKSLKELFIDSPTEPSGYEVGDIKVKYSRDKYPNWIITDVRFPNEAKAIKDKEGIVIRVNRDRYLWTGDFYNWEDFSKVVFKDTGEYPDKKYADTHYRTTISSHISETALDNYEFDYTIENSGTIEDLIEKVKQMLIHFKLL